MGCVSLKEGLEYAKKLQIPFVCYEISSEEERSVCKELNDLIGVKGLIEFFDHTEPL